MTVSTDLKGFKVINGILYEVTSKGLVKSKETLKIEDIKEVK